MIFDEEFANVTNVPVFPLYLFFLVLVALSVVVLIKAVGVILVIALLTLPASSARLLSKNFKHIIGWAIGLAVLENLLGIFLSYHFNMPTGPTIILIAAIVYLLIIGLKRARLIKKTTSV
jgi:zinc transport system permease protein